MKRKSALIQKYPVKGNAVGNYQPKIYSNLLWNFKTGIISDKVYQHLEKKNLLLEEQKGCRHASRGTKDQLLIDKIVIRNSKSRKANLNIAWAWVNLHMVPRFFTKVLKPVFATLHKEGHDIIGLFWWLDSVWEWLNWLQMAIKLFQVLSFQFHP